MGSPRKPAAKLALFGCLIFAPAAVLYTMLTIESDAALMQRLDEVPAPRVPVVEETRPEVVQAAIVPQANAAPRPIPVQSPAATPDLHTLIDETKVYHEAYPELLHRQENWQSASNLRKAEIRQFLSTTDSWGNGFNELLRQMPRTLPRELFQADVTWEASNILASRLMFQLDDAQGQKAAESFQALVTLAASVRVMRDQANISQMLTQMNAQYLRLRRTRPLNTEELQTLLLALQADPGWTIHDEMARARRGYAQYLKNWTEFTPTKAISSYGALKGTKLWLWKTPLFRTLFNRDVQLFLDNMDTLVNLAAEPWYKGEQQFANLNTQSKTLPRTYTANVHWLPGTLSAYRLLVANQAACDLLYLGLLTELYSRAHGEGPKALGSLTDWTGEPLPLDPFTGVPYGFAANGAHLEFSSPGPSNPGIEPLKLSWRVELD